MTDGDNLSPQRRHSDTDVAELRVHVATMVQQVTSLGEKSISRKEVELMDRAAALEHTAIRSELAGMLAQADVEHKAIREKVAAGVELSNTEHAAIRRELATAAVAITNLGAATRELILDERRETEKAFKNLTDNVIGGLSASVTKFQTAVEKKHDDLERTDKQQGQLIWGILITAFIGSLGIIAALLSYAHAIQSGKNALGL